MQGAKSTILDDISLAEFTVIIKKFKRRKAPRPDGVPVELYKEITG